MYSFQAIYGKENSENDDYLYNSIRENIIEKKYSYILVPEQYSLSCEKSFIKRLGASAQQYGEVLTFARLSNLVLNKVGPLRGNYINNAGKNMLISRAIQISEGQLRYFTKGTDKEGFTTTILNIITEFKRYNVTSEILFKASEKCIDKTLANKLYDFSLILEKFNALSTEKYNNSDDNAEIIIPRIKMCDFPENTTLYISFFKSFTPLEYKILRELMNVMNVKILLCADDLNFPSEIFETSAYTYKKLYEISLESGNEVLEPLKLKCDKLYRKDELNVLADMYFSMGNVANFPKKANRIHILNPLDSYNEVRDTALIINNLCKNHNYKHSDFLVLAGDLSVYRKFIPQLFSKYGVSYFIDAKEPVMKTPLYRLISFLLNTAVYGISYDRLMNIARLNLLNVNQRELDIFDNYLIASGASHQMFNSLEPWTFNPDKHLFDMEVVNRVKEAILTPVRDFVKGISGRKTVNDICLHICGWLNKYKMSEKINELMQKYEGAGDFKRAALYKSSGNCLSAQLRQMSDILGDMPATYKKFRSIFNSAASAINVGIIPQTLDGVMVSEISHFRNTSPKVVIVLGVNDGVFPKNFPVYGILSDIEREELKKLDIELAPTALSKQLEERYHIFDVLRTATSRLYLSVPKQDNEKKALLPSPIIKKITEFFPETDFEIFDENSEIFTCDKTAAFDILISKIGKSTDASPKWEYIKNLFLDFEKYREKLNNAEKLVSFCKAPEVLSRAMVKALYGKNLSLSVSRLERFNMCAFSYFLKYGLFLSPRLTADFKSNDLGSVLHLILSEYFTQKEQEKADYEEITFDNLEKEIYKLSDEISKNYNSLLYETSAYYRYFSLKIRDIAAISAWEVVKFYQNSNFRPYGFELEIGGKTPDIPAKIIKTKYGDAKFSGKIDRADHCSIKNTDYISILDYKSSIKRLHKADIENGVQLQPLAYMNAICSSIQNSEPAAILYMHLNNPLLSFKNRPTRDVLEQERHKKVVLTGWTSNDSFVLSLLDKSSDSSAIPEKSVERMLKSEFEHALKIANEKIHQSTTEIFEGKIDINPYISKDVDACAFCDFKPICTLKNYEEQKENEKGENENVI